MVSICDSVKLTSRRKKKQKQKGNPNFGGPLKKYIQKTLGTKEQKDAVTAYIFFNDYGSHGSMHANAQHIVNINTCMCMEFPTRRAHDSMRKSPTSPSHGNGYAEP